MMVKEHVVTMPSLRMLKLCCLVFLSTSCCNGHSQDGRGGESTVPVEDDVGRLVVSSDAPDEEPAVIPLERGLALKKVYDQGFLAYPSTGLGNGRRSVL